MVGSKKNRNDDRYFLVYFESKLYRLNSGIVTIRQMQPDDVRRVHKIEQKNFVMPWSIQVFSYEVKNNPHSLTLVAERNGTLIGYSVSYIIVDEMHLLNLSVDKKYQRQKTGELLLSINIDYAKKMKCLSITLEVRESNRAAIDLYHKFGFNQVGIRKGYYEPNAEDALVMSKNI